MSARLSIILTCRDKYELLRQAIESVFRQTFKDWELIIADDDSQDERVRSLLSSLERDPRINVKIFWGKPVTESYRKTHKMNAIRINAARSMIAGKYVSYLGDDNEYYPDRCERLVHILDADEDIGIVFDQVKWVMFDGREIHQDEYKYVYPEPYEEGHEDLLKAIAPSTYLCTDSVIHRLPGKCCADWPTDLQLATPVDWRFWLRLHSVGYKIKRVDAIGERAVFPGTWRNGITVEQVIGARKALPRVTKNKRSEEMAGKVRLKQRRKLEEKKSKRDRAMDARGKVWCVNISGKRQQITIPGGGAPIVVEPEGRVQETFVRASGGLFPGFAYDTRIETPPLKKVLAEKPKAEPVTFKRVETEDVKVEDDSVYEEAALPPPKPAPVPPPKFKRIKTMEEDEKSPFDEPTEKDIPTVDDVPVGRVCSKCGAPIYARSKSGLCRVCYRQRKK